MSQHQGRRAVFACVCFHVNRILSVLSYAVALHPYGDPSCSPPYFLKSPLTKCCICFPRYDSQVCWHTHCTVSAILSLFPLSHSSLLNLFKIFRELNLPFRLHHVTSQTCLLVSFLFSKELINLLMFVLVSLPAFFSLLLFCTLACVSVSKQSHIVREFSQGYLQRFFYLS